MWKCDRCGASVPSDCRCRPASPPPYTPLPKGGTLRWAVAIKRHCEETKFVAWFSHEAEARRNAESHVEANAHQCIVYLLKQEDTCESQRVTVMKPNWRGI